MVLSSPGLPNKPILIAGASGLIGQALVRRLGDAEIVGWRRSDGDLREMEAARRMLAKAPFGVVFLLSATQGGVADNVARPVAFLEDNALIAINVLRACAEAGVKRVVYAGSTAVYPASAPQPYREEQIGAGSLDATHASYALAKLVGIRLCDAYSASDEHCFTPAILTNIYGRGGSFDPTQATVVAAMARKAVEARRTGERAMSVWGTGNATRDLLYADDAADALIRIAAQTDLEGAINVSSGVEVSIRDIAEAAAKAAGFEGQLAFDTSKPEGVARRVSDASRLGALGFRPRISLAEGMAAMVADFEQRFPD